MPNGHRSLGIATLAAALLISFGLGAYWTGLPYPQERYQPYQDSNDNEGGALSTVANVATPVVERTPCNNPKSQTESDLCAQWRAAKAAEKSAEWTIYGFWATLAGMALLTWQIMLTREAVKDTGDATIAMQEANAIAKRTHQMQLRAYVGIDEIKAERFRPALTPTFGFKIKNAGQSPALRVRCHAQLFVEMNQTPHEVKIRFGDTLNQSVITILPGQSPNVEWKFPHPLDPEIYKAVTDGIAVFVYAGVVEYWDIFGKRHISTFKNFVNREQMGTRESLTLSACSKGNHSN